MAIFGQTTIHAAPHLNLIAGGRYTVERLGVDLRPIGAPTYSQRPKLNTEKFSWKLGAQYEFSRDLMAYATWSRGYKGGQIALGDPTDPTSLPTIIRPEIPTACELGVKASTADGRLGMDVSGFYTTIKDYQGQQCSPAEGGGLNCLPQTISGVKSRGIEVNVFGRPVRHGSFNLGGIWNKGTYPGDFLGQDGSDLGGLQLQSAPEWKVTATGEVTPPLGSVSVPSGQHLSRKLGSKYGTVRLRAAPETRSGLTKFPNGHSAHLGGPWGTSRVQPAARCGSALVIALSRCP